MSHKAASRQLARLLQEQLSYKGRKKKKTLQRSFERDDKVFLEDVRQPDAPDTDCEIAKTTEYVSLWETPLVSKYRLSDWLLIVKFRNRNGTYRCGGRFLAYNPSTGHVVLAKYDSDNGCSSCGEGAEPSWSGITNAVRKDHHKMHWTQLANWANKMVDPSMTSRRLDSRDFGYVPLSIIYATFRYLISSRDLSQIAYQWTPRVWTPRRYQAVIKVQAMVRGWLFRHKILYNPETVIGRKFVMAQWKALQVS